MSRASRRRLALAVLSALAASPAAFAIDRQWTENGGGLFQLPTNWNPEGVPETGDVAVFDLHSSGYAVLFEADAATSGLRILSDTVTLDLGGHTYNAGADLQVAPGNAPQNQSANLTVLGGALQSQGTNVIAGGLGSAGSLTLGKAASFGGANGQLRVGASGTGVFNIREGSDATLASLSVGAGITAGAPNPANGAVNISGLGSMLTVTGGATIGESANGSVSVLDGARFTTPNVTLASQPFGRGSVLVSGPGSTWLANGRIDVGPGVGTITALDGARIQSFGARLGAASFPGSSTTVLLSGTNTAWTNTSLPFDIGAFGNASVTIADGASLSITSAAIGVMSGSPTAPSSVATVRVTGAGSTLKAAQTLNFNMLGRTNLIVEAGGSISAMTLIYGTSPGPTTANISIDGAGSTISLNSTLLLNRHNIGITNGGTLLSGGASLANLVQDSAVTVRIAGHGSSWSSTGQFQMSQSNGGSAQLYLEDGGQLTTPSLIISGSPTSPGLLSVSGEGSRLRVTQGQSFMIGNQTNMPAELHVKDGGVATSSVPIRIAAASRLVLDGGIVSTLGNAPIESAGVILHSGGTLGGGVVINNGEIHLRSHEATIAAASQFQNNRLLHGTGRITGSVVNGFSGEIRAGKGDRLVFGHQMLSGTVSNAGRLTLMDDGAMEFNGPLSNAASGVITFSGGGALHVFGPPVAVAPPARNDGQIIFAAGSGDFVAALANQAATSQVIVTGGGTATFHGPVAHEQGEFRISEGSTAVFLGAVTGDGAFTGTGGKFIEAGENAVGELATGGETTVQAPAGLVVTRLQENALTVRGRVRLRSARSRSELNDLAIEGAGVVDLNDNDLIIHTGDARQAAVLAEVTGYVASARNASAGKWQGPGLTSTAAAQTPFTTLAVGAAGDEAVAVRYTYDGDATLDGRIDADDYFAIDSGFANQPEALLFAQGNFNYDGRIDADDYFLIDSAFAGQGAPMPAGAVSAVFAVPEPGVGMLLLAVGRAVAARRRG